MRPLLSLGNCNTFNNTERYYIQNTKVLTSLFRIRTGAASWWGWAALNPQLKNSSDKRLPGCSVQQQQRQSCQSTQQQWEYAEWQRGGRKQNGREAAAAGSGGTGRPWGGEAVEIAAVMNKWQGKQWWNSSSKLGQKRVMFSTRTIFKEAPGARQKLHNQWDEMTCMGRIHYWLFDGSIKNNPNHRVYLRPGQ